MAMRIGGSYGTAIAYGFTVPKNKSMQEKIAEKQEMEQRSGDISDLPEKQQQPETERTTGESQNFSNVNELTAYLRENFKVVSGGMASISSKYLQKCLTDSDSREQFLILCRRQMKNTPIARTKLASWGCRLQLTTTARFHPSPAKRR